MTEPKRTPGKLVYTEITTEQGRQMAVGYRYGIWADTWTPTSSKSVSVAFVKQRDDAEYIVCAVNAYEPMLEALRIAQSELIDAQGEWAGVSETFAPSWTHLIKSALSQIESVIQQAEGGK